MVWNGGQCPACGEDMPKGMVHCRYCHAILDLDAPSTKPGPEDSSGSQVVGGSVPIPPAAKEPSRRRPKLRAATNEELAPEQRAPLSRNFYPALLSKAKFNHTAARLITLLVVLLLLCPLLVSGPVPGADSPVSLTWPMVHSGDEPHYLVLINSLISDGDLDVSNN